MRFIDQDHMLRPALTKIALEHDSRIEHVIIIANNDVHPVGDIQRQLEGADLVLPGYNRNVVAIQPLDSQQLAHRRLPVNEKLVPNEVNLALKLIEGMTAEFDPAKYHDTYSEDVKKLIEDKAKGEKRQAPTPKPARSNVIDLVAALQESLAQKKPRKRGAA